MADYDLVWDVAGTHWYETGISHGVLYPMDNGVYGDGVAWNGLTSVSESPDGADANDLWADNIKYASLRSAETFGGTIEAYTYPDEWAACDGSKSIGNGGIYVGQQPRKSFGLSYQTEQGNDVDSEIDDGYKIHLVYNCTASPSDRQYETINDSPDAITFSWEYTSNPVAFTDANAIAAKLKPVSCITIDSKKVISSAETVDAGQNKLNSLLQVLYGTKGEGNAAVKAKLPTPDQIYKWATGATNPFA